MHQLLLKIRRALVRRRAAFDLARVTARIARTRKRAERDHDRLVREFDAAAAQIGRGGLGGQAVPLRHLAGLATELAALFPTAFGPGPFEDVHGFDAAASAKSGAALLDAVASVEEAVTRRDRWRAPARRDIEAAAGDILAHMALTDDPVLRWKMLDEVQAAVLDVVGPAAARSIAVLGMP